jgi:hypothetical protein
MSYSDREFDDCLPNETAIANQYGALCTTNTYVTNTNKLIARLASFPFSKGVGDELSWQRVWTLIDERNSIFASEMYKLQSQMSTVHPPWEFFFLLVPPPPGVSFYLDLFEKSWTFW